MFSKYVQKILRISEHLNPDTNSISVANEFYQPINNINIQLAEIHIDNIIMLNDRYKNQKSIAAAFGQVFSQNNEDGIISEIFRRIGTKSNKFIEIGAGDGIENTTRLLLETGWSGIWLEAGDKEIASIRNVVRNSINSNDIILIDKKVDMENVEELIISAVNFEPDYISIDIDYNTSHIWRKLAQLKPRLFCIEYNAHYPPSVNYEVPYKDDGLWTGTTRFGASLKALENIGREYGYSLVGCDIFGVNAFFVRNDLCDEDKFLGPFTAENHYEPPRFNSVRMRGHARHPEY